MGDFAIYYNESTGAYQVNVPNKSMTGWVQQTDLGTFSDSFDAQDAMKVTKLYRQYFDRNASAEEVGEWTGRLPALKTQLASDYETASGIPYDGSPISEGNEQTNNQLGASSSTSSSSINTLYQKYFGRDAKETELTFWETQPVADLETELAGLYTEKTGIAYDGSPIPEGSFYTENQLASNNGAEPETPTPGETPTPTPTPGEAPTVNPGAVNAVNQMYQKYFGRNADQPEIDWWTTQPLTDLELELSTLYETKTQHAYDGSPIPEGETTSQNDIDNGISTKESMEMIDAAIADGSITPEIGAIWKLTIENYPPGIEFDTKKILETFEGIKESTIDPYFDELIDIAKADVETAFGNLTEARKREWETQKINAEQNIKGAKSGLESSGMTFSGKAVEQLGKKSAFTEEEKIPFGGGALPEGLVNTSNRLLASGTQARHDSDVYGLVSGAENLLGSERVDSMNLPGIDRPDVVTTGASDEARDAASGGTLSSIIDNYNESLKLNTNL